MGVSVIIPTLNEAGNIERVIEGVARQKLDQILIVDGHSTDNTVELARGLGQKVVFQEGRGLGLAIKKGIENTREDIIVIVDADGSHNPEDITRLVEKVGQGYDLVVASRYLHRPRIKGVFSSDAESRSYDDTLIREFGNRVFTYMCRRLYGFEIHDVLMGFKAFRRSIFDRVKIKEYGQEFDAEILIKAKKAGFKIGEVPVIEQRRVYGKSKLSVPYHGFKILSVIIKEIFAK